MTTFTVILQAHLHCSPSHTTRDLIDADSFEAAEAVAIALWRDADSRFIYSPLVTVRHCAKRDFGVDK